MERKGGMNSVKYGRVLACALAMLLSGCISSSQVTSGAMLQEQVIVAPDPGAVEFVYEPPLIDVIDIPPGLDPEGAYYRPAHQMIVEVKEGRWQYYRQQP